MESLFKLEFPKVVKLNPFNVEEHLLNACCQVLCYILTIDKKISLHMTQSFRDAEWIKMLLHIGQNFSILCKIDFKFPLQFMQRIHPASCWDTNICI